MTTTLERKHPRLNLYFLKTDFDGSRKQEAAWYEKMADDRAMSVRLNGRSVAGLVIACWPFPVEKCMRLAFKPDARQPVREQSTPLAKAQPAHTSALAEYPYLGALALGRVPRR